ncbi:hypothetical protein L083_3487 [Actinoplanes sp. N902-109]|nr:hypothetical protein L083_3487 [Actinoplanes sp. N902-109]
MLTGLIGNAEVLIVNGDSLIGQPGSSRRPVVRRPGEDADGAQPAPREETPTTLSPRPARTHRLR